MNKTATIAVNRKALTMRVKRELAKRGQRLHNDRRGWKNNFIVIDEAKGAIVASNVNLETLARDIGALEKWEKLADRFISYAPIVTIAPAKPAKRATTKKKVAAHA